MISFLEGEVVEKGANRVVLAVGGVGYDVLVPTSVVSKLPPIGKTARVHTRMVVRDDAMVAVRLLRHRRTRRSSTC